jgi:uncharacterized membrane protein
MMKLKSQPTKPMIAAFKLKIRGAGIQRKSAFIHFSSYRVNTFNMMRGKKLVGCGAKQKERIFPCAHNIIKVLKF